MLGVILAGVACLVMSIVTWKAGVSCYYKRECSSIQQWLLTPSLKLRTNSGDSRPERLVRELATFRDRPAEVIKLVNEALGEIDYETRGARRVARACSRVSITAGMAGACIEIAFYVTTSTERAATLGVIAAAMGIAGAVSCAVIGQWATRGALLRRRLWDDFVRSILKSEFPQTAWSVRAPGLRPTRELLDGQDT